MPINKMHELIDELNEASDLYYNTGTSPLTDAQFDAKLIELANLEDKFNVQFSNSPTQRVGAPVLTGLKTFVMTDRPMLSLEKVYDMDKIKSFQSNYGDVLAMIKCDGVSVRLIYDRGTLIAATTRGDGAIGTDISEHAKFFKNVPLRIDRPGRYVIDGEAIIKDADFQEVIRFEELANQRNAVAGTLNSLDVATVIQRKISFIAWDVIVGANSNLLSERLDQADSLGFETVYRSFDNTNNEVMDRAKELGIPCDGVVWKIDDVNVGFTLGQTKHHFKNGVAWKPQDNIAFSELTDIEWSMGRTGVLTPVAIFDPVALDGSVISRASLHNVSVMRETLHDTPFLGQIVTIVKKNMIIPQIIQAESVEDAVETMTNVHFFKLPTECPICKASLIQKQENETIELFCPNNDCAGKLVNTLDHFCGKTGLDIKGLSKATLEKLIDLGWIDSIADIFYLKDKRSEWIQLPGFGERSVDNILNAIEAARVCDLDKFICALGIPLIGSVAATCLAKAFNSWAEFYNSISADFKYYELPNFGTEMDFSLHHFDYEVANLLANSILTIKDYTVANDMVNDSKLKDKSIVITGKLQSFKNRNAFKKIIESHGGKVVDSVSKNTFCLINNDTESTSEKNLTAKKLNIPIFTEQYFITNFLEK